MSDKVVTEKMGEALVITGTLAQIDWMRATIKQIAGDGQFGNLEQAAKRLDFRRALTEHAMVAYLDGKVLRVSSSGTHAWAEEERLASNHMAALRSVSFRATSLNLAAAFAWQFAAQMRASNLPIETLAASQQASEADALAEEASRHLDQDALLDAENRWLSAAYERILASSGEARAREWRRAERDACHRQRVIADSARAWRADAKAALDATMRTS